MHRFLDPDHPVRQLTRLRCLTVCHRVAGADDRQRFALDEDAQTSFYWQLRARAAERRLHEPEALVLSTCNRTEIYLATTETDGDDPAVDLVRDLLADMLDLRDGDADRMRCLTGVDVVRHLLRVASGLESVVLGETQILRQLRDAFECAVAADAVGPGLHGIIHLAFRTGRRVRSETRIADGQVSVASVGIELARQQLGGSLAGRHVLVVGAGKVGRLTVKQLVEAGIGSVVFANRTRAKSEQLADRARRSGVDARVIELADVPAAMPAADLIVTAIGGRAPAFAAPQLDALRRRAGADARPTVILDLGLPPNVDPDAVAALPDCVTRLDVDDLSDATAAGRRQREQEVPAVERMIEDELGGLTDHHGAVRKAVLTALYRRFSDVARCEAARQERHGIPESRDDLEQFAGRLVRKLLAPVSTRWSRRASAPDAGELELLAAAFDLQMGEADDEVQA